MPEIGALLELSKAVAARAGTRLLETFAERTAYTHSLDLPREVKSAADRLMETEILGALAETGLAVLSEESGYSGARAAADPWFIVDPLDGTFNFIKDLGPSAVSIALWQAERPVFGVIFSLQDRQLIWGGPGLGAQRGDRSLSVSTTTRLDHASLCTGFPVRFDMTNRDATAGFFRAVNCFAKVRMLGSAAMSLVQVARGSADVYSEHNIMLWDIAAGVAIVEGAGGACALAKTGDEWCYQVTAANSELLAQLVAGTSGSVPVPGESL